MMGMPHVNKFDIKQDRVLVNNSELQDKSLVEQASQGCEIVQKCVDYNNAYPDLVSLLPLGLSQKYLNLNFGASNASLVQILGGTAFPDFMFQQFENAELKCSCGIFNLLNMGWMVVDDALFVWDYSNSSRFQQVRKFNGLISTVELCVAPKFLNDHEDMSHILVIATATDLHVIGVRLRENNAFEFELLPEYAVALDEVLVLQIACTSKGRIFFVTTNGDVMELILRQETRWFGSEKSAEKVSRSARTPWWLPTVLANWASNDFVIQLFVDDFRSAIYAITKENHIVVYELGKDGQEFYQRKAVFQSLMSDYVRLSANLEGTGLSSFRAAVSAICPIDPVESRVIDFVAISASGVRFFFKSHADRIELVHVREPPALRNAQGYSGTPLVASQGCQHYGSGVFIGAFPLSEESDALVVAVQESGTIRQTVSERPYLYELHGAVQLGSKVWRIIPVSSPRSPHYFRDLRLHEFLILTNLGITRAIVSRPVDFVRQLVQEFSAGRPISSKSFSSGAAFGSHGATDSGSWSELLSLYTPGEVAAILFGIGAGNSSYRPTVELAFSNGHYQLNRSFELKVAQKACQLLLSSLFDVGLVATSFNASVSLSALKGMTARSAGIYLYGSRVLESVWSQCLFATESTKPQEESGLALRIPLKKGDLLQLQHSLREVLTLLRECPSLIEMEPLSENSVTNDRLHKEYSDRMSFKCVLEASLQLSVLVSILQEYKFLVLLSKSTTPAERELLAQVTFSKFIGNSDDQKLVCQTVRKLVLDAIRSVQSTESSQNLADLLHAQCPLFFNETESVLFKAFHSLAQAERVPVNARQSLQSALVQFKEAAGALSLHNLEIVLDRFAGFGAFAFALELCSACLQQATSAHVREYLQGYIFKLLLDVLRLEAEASDAESQSVVSAPLTRALSVHQLIEERKNALKALLKSPDQQFHFKLYQFLFEQKQLGLILEIDHPFVEKWLVEKQTLDTSLADLWWKYAVRRRQYNKAAKIQYALALTDHFALDLEKRMQYLASALANLKSIAYSGDSQEEELVNDIRWARDRSQIQLLALQALQERFAEVSSAEERAALDEAASQLNSQILDISELHNTVVKRFSLFTIALHIYKVTKYDDVALIVDTWRRIIEQAAGSCRKLTPWMAVGNQVEQLVGQFYPDLSVVPLSDVVNLLESFGLSAEPKPPVGWAVDALLAARVPAIVLLKVYEHIQSNKLAPWSNPSSFKYLEQQVCYLVDESRKRQNVKPN